MKKVGSLVLTREKIGGKKNDETVKQHEGWKNVGRKSDPK